MSGEYKVIKLPVSFTCGNIERVELQRLFHIGDFTIE